MMTMCLTLVFVRSRKCYTQKADAFETFNFESFIFIIFYLSCNNSMLTNALVKPTKEMD